MIPNEYDHLIDQEKIAEASDRYAAAEKRSKRAALDLDETKRAHDTARVTSERAVNGEGDISALDAEHALYAAEIALSAAKKVDEAARKTLQKAFAWRPIARGLAHVPVYVQAARNMVAAGAKADKARALLAEAASEHNASSDLFSACYQEGVPHPGGISPPQYPVGSEADAVAVFRARGFDVISGKFPWNPQPL